ncbi:DUF4238 domain-containing protein [Aeromonas hydrophila]
MSKKKNQHYVSQFYLKNWSIDGQKVYAYLKKPIFMNTKEIASENYFYRIQSINSPTRNILLKLLAKLKSPLISGLLKDTIDSLYIVDLLGKKSDNKQLKDEEAKFKTNAVENIYSIIEECAAVDIGTILNNNIKTFDINNYQNVLRYATYQLVRTQKGRDRFKTDASDELYEKDIDFQTYHTFQSLILAEKLTLSLIERLYKITLLNNDTDINFITNDNPAINLNKIEDFDVKLYLPLSPRKAIIVENSGIKDEDAQHIKNLILSDKEYDKYFINERTSSIDEVHSLNKIMWNYKHRSVYAITADEINVYAKNQDAVNNKKL